MNNILIVSNVNHIDEHLKLAKDYDTALEINDFFNPQILDDEDEITRIINIYREKCVPVGSTMHGAFYDIIPFSFDARIRKLACMRMRQSMEIAAQLGVSGVVFHANSNSDLSGAGYDEMVLIGLESILAELLTEYPGISIYVENMFEREPDLFVRLAERMSGYGNFGICLDWAHANIYGRNIAQWVIKLKDYVKHLHINDNDLVKDLHLAVGAGKLDWELFGEYYEKYFKNCSVLVETTSPKMQEESLEYIKCKGW